MPLTAKPKSLPIYILRVYLEEVKMLDYRLLKNVANVSDREVNPRLDRKNKMAQEEVSWQEIAGMFISHRNKIVWYLR